MNNFIHALTTCVLFKNFKEESLSDLLDKIDYRILSFSKDQTIAIEGEKCSSIGIILKGSIEIKKIFASGKTVTIARLTNGHIFGEVIIFSDVNEYPSTITSVTNTEILFILKSDIVKLCSINTEVLNNFMGLLSNKILMLNNKLRNLSYQTLRQKISSYLLDSYHIQKKLTITLPLSRKEVAEQLGIPRPSLSRELISMKQDGLIDFNKNTFTILDLASLEDSLLD